MDSDHEIAKVIAGFMVTVAEMTKTKAESKTQTLTYARSLVGVDDPVVLRAAAGAVRHLPAPMEVPVDRLESHDKFAAMLGVTSTEDQLIAAINARSWLLELADEIEARP